MYLSTEEPELTLLQETSHDVLKAEYKKLFNSNKELLESIYYAASIQQGLLPHERHFKRNFQDFFVLYKPQHIIGGDLYWVGQKNNIAYFATADCTGHGVSGALLSVLAVSFLNYILLGKEVHDLGTALSELDKKWLETFNSNLDYVFDNDWMEIALTSFDFKTRELKFAGAKSKLYLVHNNEMIVLEGDSYPIGGWQIEKNRLFKERKLTIPTNTMVYSSSDGFQDQFGEVSGKRFTSKQLQILLLNIAPLTMSKQKQILEDAFHSWKGNQAQTDDVCLMGIKL